MDQRRKFRRNVDKIFGIDMMLVDIPESLHVSNISIFVSRLNMLDNNFMDLIFDFANNHINDDGALLIFYLDEL